MYLGQSINHSPYILRSISKTGQVSSNCGEVPEFLLAHVPPVRKNASRALSDSDGGIGVSSFIPRITFMKIMRFYDKGNCSPQCERENAPMFVS